MIQLELSTALAIYGALIAGGAFAIWLYTEITTRHAYHGLENQNVSRRDHYTCTYPDQHADTAPDCPRCHSLHRARDKGARLVKPSRAATEPPAEPAAEQPRRNPSRRKRPRARSRGPRRRR